MSRLLRHPTAIFAIGIAEAGCYALAAVIDIINLKF